MTTLRDSLARAGKSSLMSPVTLRIRVSDPRYTTSQKIAHLRHAVAVASDAGDGELYRTAVQLLDGMAAMPRQSPN